MAGKISTLMAAGETIPRTAMYGLPAFPPIGRPIRMASGSGKTTTAGLGWITNPGDGRRSITARGTFARASAGAGSPARDPAVTGGIRPWLAFSASAAVWGWVSVSVAAAGFRWLRSKFFIRGTGAADLAAGRSEPGL